MNDNFYKQAIEDSSMGYAFHRIICDKDDMPFDFEFIKVNAAFEKLTGLVSSSLVGRRVSEVLLVTSLYEFACMKFYSDIKIMEKKEFEQFLEPQKKWYKLNVYSPSKNYLVMRLIDISLEKAQLNEFKILEEEKENRVAELIIANNELAFQNNEKENRAAELIIANKELAFQNEEKEKRAAELIIANKELAFQNEEKDKRAAELIIADKELAFQSEEKEKRAAELIIADKELVFQSEEKEKRAAELIIADKELVFQSEEKEKRAAELIIANKELAFQNEEKDKRAAELIIANKELAFQSEEKDKRAAELIVANKELAFQNEEKDKRAAELIVANKELAFQNKEKGRREMQTDVLKEQNIELEIQKKQLDETNQLKNAFLSNMSHELRTPLNAIVGFTELALKTSLNQKQHNYLSKIKISSHTLLRLINDILDLSKIEAGKLELEISTFNLEEVLQKVINQVSAKSQEKGLVLMVSIDENVPKSLSGDSMRLGQILLNLASNAVKFTEKGELVFHVELLENDGVSALLQFSVKDTGIGLTEEQIKKLFQPFTQADASTTRNYGGTGLGLSISQKLVNLMNGNIWVESKAGVGSTFFFTTKINIVDKKRFRHYKNKWVMKVLVVDDKEDSRKIIGSMLADMSLDATMSTSGEEAIAILEKTKEDNRYDLVIMDWKMPGIDGIETSRRMKKLFPSEKAPAIILLTAYSGEGVQEQAQQIGLLGAVLYKPVTPSLLFTAIMNICGKDGFEEISTEPDKGEDIEYLSQFRGIRVLLVEDNEINREVAQEIIQEAGMNVSIANNGREAVDMVKSNTYDIVLMDIQMPIMDGYDATREIRKDSAFAALPIIAMTSNALLSDQQKCLQSGMNDHVAKPISTIQLFQKISYWMKAENATNLGKETLEVLTQHTSKNEALEINNGINPNLLGIDVQTGLRRLAGNQKLYYKLLAKFYNNYKHAIKEILFVLERGDLKAAEILVHTIKGAAGSVGAQDVYVAASALEVEFRAKRMDDVELLLKQFKKALEQAFTSILLEDIQGSHSSGPEMSLMNPILEGLKKLLRDNNMDAVESIDEIVTMAKNTAFADKAVEMKDYIEQYDFECALGILNEILNSIMEELKDEKRK